MHTGGRFPHTVHVRSLSSDTADQGRLTPVPCLANPHNRLCNRHTHVRADPNLYSLPYYS